MPTVVELSKHHTEIRNTYRSERNILSVTRRNVAIATTLALSFTLLAALPSNADDTVWLSGIPNSSTITSPNSTLVNGTLTTSTGAPFPAGAEVVMFAQPANDVLDALAVGESVGVDVVAKANTTATGTFSMRLRATNALQAYADVHNNINFTIMAVNNGEVASFATSRTIIPYVAPCAACRAIDPAATGPATPASPAQLVSTSVNTSIAADVAASASTPDSISVQASPIEADAGATAAPAIGDSFDKTQTCDTTRVKTYPNGLVVLGTAHVASAATHVTSDFVYESAKSTSVGWAISTSGRIGSFKQEGMHTTSGSSEIGFPAHTAPGNWKFSGNFHFGKFKYTCRDVWSTVDHLVNYQVYATTQTVGMDTAATTFPATSTDCGALEYGGGYYTEQKAKASELSNSANISAVVDDIGIGLTSRSGYSTSAKLTYKNNATSHDRKICMGSGKKIYVTVP